MAMKRRKFIKLLGGAAATWPLAARAQQGVRRIGVLMSFDDPSTQSYLTAFRGALAKLGWTEGNNLRTEFAGALVMRIESGRSQKN
jgi:putative ABC transport system substrate-binding protein